MLVACRQLVPVVVITQSVIYESACFTVILQSVAVIFIGAAIFQHIENWSVERDPKLEFFKCIYFIVTTMTTVGYGDVGPTSNLSMAFTILLMVYLVLILFPHLVDAATDFSRITIFNSAPARYPHQPVILWQAKGELPVQKLHKFSQELFSEDQDQRVSICLVGEAPPSEELQVYLSIPRAETILYIEGDLRNDAVADRAGVQYAKACILMHSDDCSAEEIVEQDERICIMGMRVRQFTMDQCVLRHLDKRPIKVVLCLNHSYNAIYFHSGFYGATTDKYAEETETMSLREIQMQCMAKGIVCPGFHSFMANLGSMRGEVCDGLSREESMERFHDQSDPWLWEYFKGHENECYMINLNEKLHQVPIPQISAALFYDTGAALFRCETSTSLETSALCHY